MAKKAVLIGINYPGTKAELRGCVNDVWRMHKCLIERYGFSENDVTVLIDTDSSYTEPTGKNIRSALSDLVGSAEEGDVLFVHYSGHGTRLPAETGEDDDTGYDECIVPSDMNLITGNSHMTWKEHKKIEDRKVVSLGGKPLKNQRLPLSVARPMMKKQKQREEKMLQERMILGRFGGKIGGSSSSSKKPTGKHKPEDRGLKLSEGRFRNGILDVKHLLKSTPTSGNDTGKNMSNTGKRQGGNWKHDKRGGGKKHEMF